MAQSFIGEIRMFAGNFAPRGWAFCNGQMLPISDNDVLFNLIGTTYGGDGQSTFALPDLRGRIPLHQGTSTTGSNFVIGQQAGVESVTLNGNQIPVHSHVPQAVSANGNQPNPAGNTWATSGLNQFTLAAPNANMNPTAIAQAGGNQPHDNLMPYLAVSFIISLFGVFPSQN